jgi:hypothetical protein
VAIQMAMGIVEVQEVMPRVVLMIRMMIMEFYSEWSRLLSVVSLCYGSRGGCNCIVDAAVLVVFL